MLADFQGDRRLPRTNDGMKRVERGCAIDQEPRSLYLFLNAKVWFGVLGVITAGESKYAFLVSSNWCDLGKARIFLRDHCTHFSNKIMG